MKDFISAILSDYAIVIYLSIAIILMFLFIIKYIKKIKKYKRQNLFDTVKYRDLNLNQALANEKRGNKE